jgi:hypothetical protein
MSYDHNKLINEIDNYTDTVFATLAFAHECRWNDSTKSIDAAVQVGLGRPMVGVQGREITPDIVIQRRPNLGTIAEVKHTFPPEREIARRDEIFRQLKNYDVDLKGWWTPSKSIEDHDLVLLTHFSHVIEAVDYLTVELAKRDIGAFRKKFAIISYIRSNQANSYFTLRRERSSCTIHIKNIMGTCVSRSCGSDNQR